MFLLLLSLVSNMCVRACYLFSRVPLFATLRTVACQAPWDSPGKNTGVSCHLFLQGIFPTQESNPCLLQLLYCKLILYLWATGEAHLTHSRYQMNVCWMKDWMEISQIHAMHWHSEILDPINPLMTICPLGLIQLSTGDMIYRQSEWFKLAPTKSMPALTCWPLEVIMTDFFFSNIENLYLYMWTTNIRKMKLAKQFYLQWRLKIS